jgi:ABC-2 type transport system ATP-binding protein
VLLVDEVLAVGDATFQQRCLDRIRAVLAEGATLVFVSHDLAAVEATCANGVWIHNGVVQAMGPIRDVLAEYRAAVEGQAADARPQVQGLVRVSEVSVGAPDGGLPGTGGPLTVNLTLGAEQRHRAWVYLGVSEGAATPIFLINPGRETVLLPGETGIQCEIASLPLPAGRYYLWCGIYENWTNGTELLGWQPLAHFDVYGPELDAAPRAVVRLSPLHVESSWEIEQAA